MFRLIEGGINLLDANGNPLATVSGVDGEELKVRVTNELIPHTIASHSDTSATGSQLDELVGGSVTNLHSHPTVSGAAAESVHFHCSGDSATFTTGAITVPFDTIALDDSNPTMFSISNGELTALRTCKVLLSYTVLVDIFSGTDRSTSSVWMESDPGGQGLWSELSNTRGYIYNRNQTNGEGSFSYTAPYSFNAGDKFRIRCERHYGNSTLIVRGIGTHGMAMLATAIGPQGPTGAGSNIIIKDESVNIINTPHSSINFKGAGVSVSDVGGGVADVIIDTPAPHTIASHSDTSATGSQLDELVGGSVTNLHSHTVASGLPPVTPLPGDVWYNTSSGTNIPYYWDESRGKWLSSGRTVFMYATRGAGTDEYMAVQNIKNNNVGYYVFDDLTITGIHCRSVSGDTSVTFTIQDEANSDATITTFSYSGTNTYFSNTVNVDVDAGSIIKVLMGPANPNLRNTLLQLSVAQRYTP